MAGSSKDNPVEIRVAERKVKTLSLWKVFVSNRRFILVTLIIGGYLLYKAIQSDEEFEKFNKLIKGGKWDDVVVEKFLGKFSGEDEVKVPTDVRLKDIHGIDDIKDEIEDLIFFLKENEKIQKTGGRIPRGVLLTGPPGTGKTMIAKAVAAEAGVPFFYASGSQFDEKFVGVGAKRIRKMFENARTKENAVIFIDEIDSLGSRGGRFGYMHRGTINQLLTELDGMKDNGKILFICATNIPGSVDKALTRPGRVDRIITVPLPDIHGRKEILKHYLNRSEHFDTDIDIHSLAKLTIGMSGAQIESIINDAAINAGKEKRSFLSKHDVHEAYERLVMGLSLAKRKSNAEDLKITAIHEIGHAMVNLLNGNHAIHKITILPRGGALGYVAFLPKTESEFANRTESAFLRDIEVSLAGRAAEEVIFGQDAITLGASSDLRKAMDVARKMVMLYGMSPMGMVQIKDPDKISDESLNEIDSAVQKIIHRAYQNAITKIKQNERALRQSADLLLEKENMTGEELREFLIGQGVSIP